MAVDEAGSAPWRDRALVRHALVGSLSVMLVIAWRVLAPGGRASNLWNPPLAHAALVLLALTLAAGPAARLWPRVAPVLPWRREMGVWSALAAGGHVVLALHEWAGWSLSPLWERFDGNDFTLEGGLAMANLVGAVALGYAFVLLATSSDAAVRVMGPRWKRVQRGATTLFLLAVLHTAYFFYLDRPGGLDHLWTGPFGAWSHPFRTVFPVLVLAVVVLRTWAFWRPRRTR